MSKVQRWGIFQPEGKFYGHRVPIRDGAEHRPAHCFCQPIFDPEEGNIVHRPAMENYTGLPGWMLSEERGMTFWPGQPQTPEPGTGALALAATAAAMRASVLRDLGL